MNYTEDINKTNINKDAVSDNENIDVEYIDYGGINNSARLLGQMLHLCAIKGCTDISLEEGVVLMRSPKPKDKRSSIVPINVAGSSTMTYLSNLSVLDKKDILPKDVKFNKLDENYLQTCIDSYSTKEITENQNLNVKFFDDEVDNLINDNTLEAKYVLMFDICRDLNDKFCTNNASLNNDELSIDMTAESNDMSM